MRPHQWVKNLFVLTPVVFAKRLDDPAAIGRSMAAFALFSLAASSIYVLNDLKDLEADRAHPIKRQRPIASGLVSARAAWVAWGMLSVFALGGSAWLDLSVLSTIVGYLILNLAYTLALKKIAYVDVLCIATGFELRVLSGTYAAQVPPTYYLLVVTFLLAVFLGFGKRMHELTQGERAQVQRSVLRSYDTRALHVLLQITAALTIVVYVVYTLDPATRASFQTHYLIVTVAFAVFGVLRFMHLVRSRPEAESPTEEMLKDKPFLINLGLWGLAVVAVLYVG